MKRKPPPKVDLTELSGERNSPYVRNRKLFEWLGDDEARASLYATLSAAGKPCLPFPSRAIRNMEDKDCKREDLRSGHETVFLLAHAEDIKHVLANREGRFSNEPYRALGTGTFMLALDDVDLRRKQIAAARRAFPTSEEEVLKLCAFAIDAAQVMSLRGPKFDLAEFSEQVALRFCSALFGFAVKDYGRIEAAMRAAYNGLNYQILGRHFTTEPLALPTAERLMGELLGRSALLIDEYQLDRDDLPEGLDKMGAGLGSFVPVMKKLARMPGELNGEELAVLVVGAMAGVVGNVQASVCIAVDAIFRANKLNEASRAAWLDDGDELQLWITGALRLNPPVAFLPRRAQADIKNLPSGLVLKAGAECILCMGAATRQALGQISDLRQLREAEKDGLIFGLVEGEFPQGGPHSCIGADLARPLVRAIVRHILRLPGLAEQLDPEDASVIRLEKRWGFGCVRYPLIYRSDRRRKQQSLNVSMRIKAPVGQNASALRALIRIGAPRIERALREARHVHFAWFEFIDNDRRLVLHTVYDGDFGAYIQHFALVVGDMFDLLFQHIEDAPQMPVAKFPGEFVDLIRRYNMAPAMGYFFSAYPKSDTAQIMRDERSRP
jgi:cytochrome P450